LAAKNRRRRRDQSGAAASARIDTSGGATVTNLIAAMVVGRSGIGAIEYGAFAAVIAIMIMFVVETVASRR
jgi:Flp pilus assembly pilin Flp